MKLKTGDNVIIISGKDRGKTGKIIRVFPEVNRILIEGVNVVKRHEKPRQAGKKGQIVNKTMPISAANAMFIDSKTGKRTRIGYKMDGGKKIRFAKKSGASV